MAIYHFSMKPVSRAKGRSAVASMAYRAGEKLTNERDGITHDHGKSRASNMPRSSCRKASTPIGRGIARRSGTPPSLPKAEGRPRCPEFEVALPHELSAEQRLEAAREMAQELADRYGAAVDFRHSCAARGERRSQSPCPYPYDHAAGDGERARRQDLS